MDIDWDKVEKDITAFGVEIYPLEECIIGYCLGSGSAMEVFEGQCNINTVTKNVAFKRHMKFKNPNLKQEDVNKILKDFRHEITLMRNLKYPTNVVQIYGVTVEERKPVLVVEVGDKTLNQYLLDKAKSSTPATWCEKIKLCMDISRGVRCLHDAGITHGDIKGENVLVFIESTGITTAKLSSSGHSSTMNPSNGDIGGNITIVAPETRGVEDLKAWEEKPTQDIFNFGLLIYQIANDGKTPHEDLEGILKVDFSNRHTEVLLANLRPDTPEAFRITVAVTTKYMPAERASLDIVEKIITGSQNVSSSQQVNTENTPLPSLTASPQSQLSPLPALEITRHSLPDSNQFCTDELKNNSKTAKFNEAKRNYEKAKSTAKNTLESYVIHYNVLDIHKLPIPESLKPSIFYEYRQLAEAGDDFAQFMSGACWINGFGTEMNDLKAVEYFTKAAEVGNGLAQNILGFCYEIGRGVVKDRSKAIEFYTMAAEAGSPKGQRNLGGCYQYGVGVPKNEFKAVEWYTKSVEAGNTPGQNSLAYCYEKGIGVTRDYCKAIELYTKAANAGFKIAEWNLDKLRRKTL